MASETTVTGRSLKAPQPRPSSLPFPRDVPRDVASTLRRSTLQPSTPQLPSAQPATRMGPTAKDSSPMDSTTGGSTAKNSTTETFLPASWRMVAPGVSSFLPALAFEGAPRTLRSLVDRVRSAGQGRPGPGAAAVLAEATRPDALLDLGNAELVDVVSSAQRLVGWVQSLQLAAVAEAVRRATDPAFVTAGIGVGDPVRDARMRASALAEAELYGRSSVVAELALACGMSEYAIGQRVDAALALREDRLGRTAVGLATGTLDWAKVCAIVTTTAGLDDGSAASVEAEVFGPGATWTNTPGLRRALDFARAVVEARRLEHHRAAGEEPGTGEPGTGEPGTGEPGTGEPGTGEPGTGEPGTGEPGTRSSEPEWSGPAERRVVCGAMRPSMGSAPGTIGLGSVWALLGAADMRLIDAVLDELARSAKSPGDARTHDQRRADALVGLFANAGDKLDAAGARPRRPAVVVTMTLETAMGLSNDPADLVGVGPIPAAMARDVAANGSWRCAVVDGVHGTLLGFGALDIHRRLPPRRHPGPTHKGSGSNLHIPGLPHRRHARRPLRQVPRGRADVRVQLQPAVPTTPSAEGRRMVHGATIHRPRRPTRHAGVDDSDRSGAQAAPTLADTIPPVRGAGPVCGLAPHGRGTSEGQWTRLRRSVCPAARARVGVRAGTR